MQSELHTLHIFRLGFSVPNAWEPGELRFRGTLSNLEVVGEGDLVPQQLLRFRVETRVDTGDAPLKVF